MNRNIFITLLLTDLLLYGLIQSCSSLFSLLPLSFSLPVGRSKANVQTWKASNNMAKNTKSATESNGSTPSVEMPAPRVDIVGVTVPHGTDSLIKLYNDAKAIRGRVIARGEQYERTGRANIKDGSVKGRTNYKSYCESNAEIAAFDLCSQIEAYAAACVGIQTLTRYDVHHADAPRVHVAAFKPRQFKKDSE